MGVNASLPAHNLSRAKIYYHQPEYEELLQTWHPGRPIAEKRQYLLDKVAIVTLVEQVRLCMVLRNYPSHMGGPVMPRIV